MMKLGKVLKSQLINSRSHCLSRRLTKAKKETLATIKESSERNLTSKHHRRCEDATRKMEDILFSVGGTERVVKTLQSFIDSAAVELPRNKSAECNGSNGCEGKLSHQRGKSQHNCDG